MLRSRRNSSKTRQIKNTQCFGQRNSQQNFVFLLFVGISGFARFSATTEMSMIRNLRTLGKTRNTKKNMVLANIN